jgi:hypothetical protein
MRVCDVCGKPLPPQMGRGGRRKRHETCSRRPQTKKSAETAPKATENLVEAVETALERLNERYTPRGYGAVAIAYRIASGKDNGSALAALHKELRATLEDIEMRADPAADDPVARAQADLRLVT